MTIRAASRFDSVEISLIRQINALATPAHVNLGIGEPNLEPDSFLREMARKAATEGSWRYTANAGNLSLREKLADRLKGTLDPASQICMVAGTQEALYAIMQAFIGPGDEVLIPDPGFVSYATLTHLAGGTPRGYPLQPPDWSVSLEGLRDSITPATRMIIVNSPSNPTGTSLSAQVGEAIVEIAREKDLLVVSDEVYQEIHYGNRPPSFLGLDERVIVVGGLSKSHSMTGLRLGWMIASPELMRPLIKAHQYIATCASAFSQTLAELIFDHPLEDQAWLQKCRTTFRRQRDTALSAIRSELDIPLDPPTGAFYAFVPVPSCDTVGLAMALARDAQVLAVPGLAFGAGGEGFLRISYAATDEQIEEGVRRIGAYLTARGR